MAGLIGALTHPVNCLASFAGQLVQHVGQDTINAVVCVVRNLSGCPTC